LLCKSINIYVLLCVVNTVLFISRLVSQLVTLKRFNTTHIWSVLPCRLVHVSTLFRVVQLIISTIMHDIF